MEPTINVLSWNVKGLNCLNCDVVIFQESKMEVVSRSIAISLWGRHLVESCIGSFSVVSLSLWREILSEV